MKEVRTIKAELRLDSDPASETKTIQGMAAVFNSPSHDLGGFIEYIRPGAFTDSLKNADIDVVALFNHDTNFLLGRQSSGTLQLEETDEGLAITLDCPETTLGKDLAILIKRGDLKGMSFAFCVVDEEFEKGADGVTIRYVNKCDLHDISVVTNPAYEATSVSLRSFEDFKKSCSRRLLNQAKLKLAKIGK